MTHFAIFDGEFSPSEAELASAFDSDALLLDSFASLGLALVAEDLTFTAVVLAAVASGSDGCGSRSDKRLAILLGLERISTSIEG